MPPDPGTAAEGRRVPGRRRIVAGIRRFLETEARSAGWRFWVLWVVATNVAFFPGLAIGQACAARIPEPSASGVVAFSFALPVGLLQWLVLRRHLPRAAAWVLATGLGWTIGAFAGAALLPWIGSGIAPGSLPWTLALGFFFLPGAITGFFLARALGPCERSRSMQATRSRPS